MSITMTGKGNEGIGGGRAGDLHVVLNVKADDRFERQGRDLYTAYTVTYPQAALGDELAIEGVDQTYTLDLPAGIQPGDMRSIRGAGLPALHGGHRGELHVQINVQVPKKLSDAQKQMMLDYAESSGGPIPKGERGGLLGNLFKKKK